MGSVDSGGGGGGRNAGAHDIPDVPDRPAHRTEKGLRAEEMRRVREKLAAENAAKARAKLAGASGGGAVGAEVEAPRIDLAMHKHAAMDKFGSREAALRDPRVQAALDKALNQPNQLAALANKTRNTTRISGERKF